MCLSGMLVAQQTFVHECSTVFCFLLRNSTFVIQKNGTFFCLGSQLLGRFAANALGNLTEHTTVDSYVLVSDLDALHFHRKNSHGFLMSLKLICF